MRGGSSDRKPIIVGPVPDLRADVMLVDPTKIAEALGDGTDRAVLAIVGNPFFAAKLNGEDLTEVARKNSSEGQKRIESWVEKTQSALVTAIEGGADGVLYVLGGADPSLNSPMEFGGLYLEHDRALLAMIADAPFNVLMVNGPPDYLDFLEDLPAHALAWEPQDNRWNFNEARAIWPHAIAAEHPEADVLFTRAYDHVSQWLTEANYV